MKEQHNQETLAYLTMSHDDQRPTTAIGLYDHDALTQPRAQTAALLTSTSDRDNISNGIGGTKTNATAAQPPRPITTGTWGVDERGSHGASSSNSSITTAANGDDSDALRDRLIEDLDYKRRRLKVQGDIAAEDTAATGELLKEIHGDQSVLVNAAKDAGLFGDDRILPGRMAEEKFAQELRDLADQMGVPDWLKEVDLAMKLREKSIASKILTRELMDKVGDRATEANATLEAVEQVSDKLQRNSGIIRTRVRDHFDKLRSAMRKRELLLLDAVDHVTAKKEKTLQGQRVEIADALSVIDRANAEASEAMNGDDIDYLHRFLKNLNNRLEVAGETFVNSKPYCTSNIPCQFGHSTLEGIIAGHGTVGDVEELAVGGPTGFGLLQWDTSRTDKRLKISEDGHSMDHVGPPGKATSMSTTGFANGRNLWRIVPNGCREGEWVSIGVCTAGLIGSAAYAQDSVIFSFTPSENSSHQSTVDGVIGHKEVGTLSAKKIKNVKYDVSPGDVIAVSLDCATGSVEYYKNSICIKTAMLFASPQQHPESSSDHYGSSSSSRSGSRTSTAVSGSGASERTEDEEESLTPRRRRSRGQESASVAAEVCWYPFATLYEKGQSVKFDKVGDGH